MFRLKLVSLITVMISIGVARDSSSPSPPTNTLPPFIKGVNLSGGEYNPGPPAKTYGKVYIYPTRQEYNYFKSINFSVIRVSFDIYRLQPINNALLNQSELARLKKTVELGLVENMYVILDPHNYGKMYNSSTSKEQIIGV